MSTLSVPFGSGVCRYLDCPTKTPQANGTHASVKDPGFAPGVLLPRPSRHNWLAYHDTCPFPTPASPRYHVSRGVGWLGSFPEPVALPAQMGQIGTEKLSCSKSPGRSPAVSGVPKPDKMVTKADIAQTLADKTQTKILSPHAQMSGNVRFCPVFSAFPPPIPVFSQVRPKTPANLSALSTIGILPNDAPNL